MGEYWRGRELLFKKGRGLYYYYPMGTRKIFEVRRYDNWDYCLRWDKSYNFWKLDYLLEHKWGFWEYKVLFKEIKSERSWKITEINEEMIQKFTKEKKIVAFPVILNKNRASLEERKELWLEHNWQLLLEWGNLSSFIGRNHCWADINCDTNKSWRIETKSEREVYVFDIAKIYSYKNDTGNDENIKKKIRLWMMMEWVYVLSKDIYNKYKTNDKE